MLASMRVLALPLLFLVPLRLCLLLPPMLFPQMPVLSLHPTPLLLLRLLLLSQRMLILHLGQHQRLQQQQDL